MCLQGRSCSRGSPQLRSPCGDQPAEHKQTSPPAWLTVMRFTSNRFTCKDHALLPETKLNHPFLQPSMGNRSPIPFAIGHVSSASITLTQTTQKGKYKDPPMPAGALPLLNLLCENRSARLEYSTRKVPPRHQQPTPPTPICK